ncbi:hypothetical protein KFU94_43440 [Chloroflexi bacterium TSY]|nr:hypothetical protein [Chloroflexi bacterium TSY]
MHQQHKVQKKVQAELLPIMSVLQAQLNHPLSMAVPTDPVLRNQCQHIHQLAMTHQLPVRYLFSMETFAGHRVYSGDKYDWVLFDIEQHPMLQEGKLPVPRRIQHQLERISATMEFDGIYIAEEVEIGSVSPYEPLRPEQFVPPPSRAMIEESNRLGGWIQTISQFLMSPWTLAAAGATLATSLPMILTGLDPILFGLRTTTGQVTPGTMASFYYLGHWAWNDEIGG